jgi:hypothetical protein
VVGTGETEATGETEETERKEETGRTEETEAREGTEGREGTERALTQRNGETELFINLSGTTPSGPVGAMR